MSVDEETVEMLRKSKSIVGYLQPIVKDQKGAILSGRHRKYADPHWPEATVEVDDPLQRELFIIHYNVQRTVSKEETRVRLMRCANLLEAKGVPKDAVAARLSGLVPYTARYVQELLPDEYKRPYTKSELVRNSNTDDWAVEDWRLTYLTVPLLPEHVTVVKDAIRKAKQALQVDDDGKAVASICKKYLEAKP